MSEQELNLRKYVIKTFIDDSKGKFDVIDGMLEKANNEEELERVLGYLKYYLFGLNNNVEKLNIFNDGKSR